MAKRFTDTDKWKKPWFRELSPLHKLVWNYVCDNCDHAGVWPADFGLMEFQLGAKISREEFLSVFTKKILLLEDGKIYIPSFVEFQYGTLNPQNNAHKAVLRILDHISPCLAPQEDLRSPSGGAQDKEKDKDKEMEMEKGEGGLGETKPKATHTTVDVTSNLSQLVKVWGETLRVMRCPREVREREREKIARAILAYGPEDTKRALTGPREEKASDGFDPKQHLSIDRVFNPKNIERFINLGSQHIHRSSQTKHKPESSALNLSDDLTHPATNIMSISAALGRFSKMAKAAGGGDAG